LIQKKFALNKTIRTEGLCTAYTTVARHYKIRTGWPKVYQKGTQQENSIKIVEKKNPVPVLGLETSALLV